MSWFGLGKSSAPAEEPVSSFSESSSFMTEHEAPVANFAPSGSSVNDIIMEEQRKVLVQQAIANMTAIAWDKCSAAKPDSSLSNAEVTCIHNVVASYLDASQFVIRKLNK
ncbi:Mitochondrial Protein Translocase (MPT) Family [Thraustotheca clavata]|uniref:Mitochondrial import inner membrane translocase subunit n=1 Tax=Thraustotheca clavata TaxID=74557 RepID=A0A1W0A3W6_9STRA|nr:Mitochondrial Protein Translocase (MPT) Family [Thraustotheca clavata]